WEDRFLVSRTPDECPSKPHPAMVLDAARELGVDRREVVVVGDAVFDIEMARAAGADAVGVSWGVNAPEALAAAGARIVVETPEALGRVLGVEAVRCAAS
ncbi:MAG: HAD family hydrolase, partial [Zetaproteobacteria bacterium]